MLIMGTMILMVFKSTVFWLLMATHTALLVIDRQNSNYHLPEMNWHAFQAVTSLLTFFLVFYGYEQSPGQGAIAIVIDEGAKWVMLLLFQSLFTWAMKEHKMLSHRTSPKQSLTMRLWNVTR
mgnify:CR=1 FL=1